MDGVTDLNRNGHGGFCRHCTAQHPLNPFLSLLYMGTMVGVSQDLVQGEPPLVSSVCLFFDVVPFPVSPISTSPFSQSGLRKPYA